MDQPDQTPTATRINSRSSLACLQCRSRHSKCDGKQPRCSKCLASEKQCQYTASRRGGLDRATLAERRKRLAKGTEARLDQITPQSIGTCDNVAIPDPSVQPLTSLHSIQNVLHGSSSDETPTLTTPDDPQANFNDLTRDPLIISYYANFHDFHPFVPPLRHFASLCQGPQGSQESPLNFRSLGAVMRLIGNLYITHEWSGSLRSQAEICLSQLQSSDPVQVQCRLLYSIALFWSNFRAEADKEIETAKDIALALGMHRQEFATANGYGDDILVESWRRTWWMLYIIDAYYAGTLGTMNLKVFHIEASVELPCEDYEYKSGVIPRPRTIEDFDCREFFEEEVTFSSFAYLIGAVRCAAFAISTSPKNATKQDSEHMIQSADSVIDAWTLLLPRAQKPVMKKDGRIDELMFQAHMLIHVATIGLHRPLSELKFNPVENVSSCAREPPPDTPKPDLTNVHTMRILKSVKAQIQLLALPIRPFHQTPFTTCMTSEGTLALLSACKYLLQDKALAIARHQIRLTIGCLKSLGEVWPRTAKNVKEIQTIARYVLETKGRSTTASITPSSSEPTSLMGSGGQTSTQTVDVLEQTGDVFPSLGSLEDICGWFNMSPELNPNAWMAGDDG